ncbi:MAG: hypothetical protein EPN14_06505, partial [Gallionella sp.]
MQNESKSRLSHLAENLDEYREWATLAQQQTGKSFFTQLREIRALRHTGGQCGISNYYWYKLYDDDYLMGRGAQDFLGWPLRQEFSVALNPRTAVLPAWDKLAFMVIAGSAGLPVAPIRACFHRAERVSEMLG